MHLYVAEMENRQKIIGYLAIAATLLSIGLGHLLDSLASSKLAISVGPPSATVLFGAFVYVFDRWAWRWHVGPLRVSQIPVLAGSWIGAVTIHQERSSTELPCLVQISQRWLRMSIVFHTPITTSTSSSATVRPGGTNLGDFRYEYHVEPREDGHGVHRHDGVARLRTDAGRWQTLRGDFFNDQHFQRSGGYTLERQASTVDVTNWLKQNPAGAYAL
jgi:hypothetical protein